MQEKKKKFNIVDILVILLLVAAIAVVGVKLAGNKVQDAISKQVTLWAEIEIEAVPENICEEVFRQNLVGQKMVSGNEYVSATVEDVWTEDYVHQIETADGTIVSAVDPSCKNLVLLVKTSVAEGTASPKIGSQELRAGKEFIAKTQGFEMTGVTRYVEFGEYTK